MKFTKFLISFALACLLLSPIFSIAALAQSTTGEPVTNQISTSLGNFEKTALGKTSSPLQTIVALIINTVLGILGIVFVAYLVYGGFVWMTAAGNQEDVGKAKKIIINSVIAVIVILLAFAIANFVFTSLGTAIFGK